MDGSSSADPMLYNVPTVHIHVDLLTVRDKKRTINAHNIDKHGKYTSAHEEKAFLCDLALGFDVMRGYISHL